MTNYPYILFNKSPLQLRQIGARGGRAFGRNQRIRRSADLHSAVGAQDGLHNLADHGRVIDDQDVQFISLNTWQTLSPFSVP